MDYCYFVAIRNAVIGQIWVLAPGHLHLHGYSKSCYCMQALIADQWCCICIHVVIFCCPHKFAMQMARDNSLLNDALIPVLHVHCERVVTCILLAI